MLVDVELENKIGFLHLDMNVASPELAAAEYFWESMSPGGIILLDDFAYHQKYTESRRVFNEFSRKTNAPILTLATGQGIIFKHVI